MTNILFGNNSKRRVITITDQTGSVELKLWGGDMVNKITQEGVSVVVKSVTVEHYNNRTSVNSTMSTQIEVNILSLFISKFLKKSTFENSVKLLRP